MARTRHLPIWRTAFDLAAHLERCVARFSRAHKYALGSELRQTARRLCRLVTRANAARAEQRARVLDERVLAVEDMKTLLLLAQEVRAFASFNEFAGAAELAVSRGKPSGGAGIAFSAPKSPQPRDGWRRRYPNKPGAGHGPKPHPKSNGQDEARAAVHCAPWPPGGGFRRVLPGRRRYRKAAPSANAHPHHDGWACQAPGPIPGPAGGMGLSRPLCPIRPTPGT